MKNIDWKTFGYYALIGAGVIILLGVSAYGAM